MEITRGMTTEVFNEWFSRCRGLLHFIACRVLGGSDRSGLAVHNCWLTASRNPPHFEHESAFRCWLMRVQINEALAILRQSEQAIPLRGVDGEACRNELVDR